MTERDLFWDGLHELGKKNHDNRVAKNPDRIKYAISQFEKNDINTYLKIPRLGIFIVGVSLMIS